MAKSKTLVQQTIVVASLTMALLAGCQSTIGIGKLLTPQLTPYAMPDSGNIASVSFGLASPSHYNNDQPVADGYLLMHRVYGSFDNVKLSIYQDAKQCLGEQPVNLQDSHSPVSVVAGVFPLATSSSISHKIHPLPSVFA